MVSRLFSLVLNVTIFTLLFSCVLSATAPTIGRRCFRGSCPALPPEDTPPVCYWSTEVVAAPTLQTSTPYVDAVQNTNNDTTMSIIAHVHLPPTLDEATNETIFAYESAIHLNISNSNCQLVEIDVTTLNQTSTRGHQDLTWLGLAALQTTHQGALYCEAAPQCSITLRSALLTGFPLTESNLVIESGENFYVAFNSTDLDICEGWIATADMYVSCNESTSDYSFCRFMFGTECPVILAQDVTPSSLPASNTASQSIGPSLEIPSQTSFPSESIGASASASAPAPIVIPPEGPITPGQGGGITIFGVKFPTIPNSRRVV